MTSNLLEARRPRPIIKVDWTPALKRINARYPSAIRSKLWSEIARIANGGNAEEAMELAKETERSGEIKFRNTLARRVRIERSSWFARLHRGERDLKLMYATIGNNLGDYIESQATKPANIPKINKRIREDMILLRRAMKTWLNSMVRDSIRISLRNQGDALKPIFKDSQEAYDDTMFEFTGLDSFFELYEAKKIVSIKTSLSKRNPAVSLGKKKWKAVQKTVLKKVMAKNILGFLPSQNIWDITTRADATVRRVIATEIGKGSSPKTIAQKIKKYLSPGKIDEAKEVGLKGVYSSPFKNALRLAKTETNRAYAKASGEYAKSKEWITGVMFNLSPIHKVSDICDGWDGQVVPKEDFNAMVDDGSFPFHPNCACFVTDVIDDKFLDKEDA